MSQKLSTDSYRKIIENFAQEIKDRKETGSKPEHTVIEFRTDRKIGKTRPIYLIPISLLQILIVTSKELLHQGMISIITGLLFQPADQLLFR